MSALDLSIIKFLKKVSLRIKTNFLLKNIIVGLIVSLILSLFIVVTSIFITIEDSVEICFIVIIINSITVIIFSIIETPKKKEIALIADSKGLKERVTTSIDFLGNNDDLSILQKQDTVKHIKNYDIKKNLPIRVPRRGLIIIAILCASCLIGSFIPSNAKQKEREMRSFKREKKEVVKKIEEEKKKVVNNDNLTKEERKKLEELLNKALKEIKEAEKRKVGEKALDRFEKKLDNFQKEEVSEKAKEEARKLKETLTKDLKEKKIKEAKEDKNKILTELNKNEEGKKLAKAIEKEEEAEISKTLNDLNNKLNNMNQAQKSKLSKVLKSAAEALSNEELKEALANGADGILDGEIDTEDLANALLSIKEKSNDSEKKPSNSPSKGNGSGSGNGSGNGGNKGTGSGNGSGGKGGQGWNTGSKDGNEEETELGEKQGINTEDRQEGKDKNLKGGKNESGNSQSVEIEKGLNFGGKKVDYESVLGDYSKEALEGLNRSNIPEAMKEAVKEYFESLK